MDRPHIIAAKLPSGMTSRPHEHGDHIPPRDGICSVGRHGGEKAGHLFNATTRRSIEVRLNGKPVHVTIDDSPIARVSIEVIVMILVAVFIGVLLGTGGGM